jgi:Do/DeqQ family serine protease
MMKQSNLFNPELKFNHINKSSKSQSNWLNQAATYTSFLLLGVGLGFGGNYLVNSPKLSAGIPENQTIVASKDNDGAKLPIVNDNLNFVAQVVQKVGPAVVRINASHPVETEIPPVFNDPFFQRFFGSSIPQIPEQQIKQGTGSGFIISEDGKILTNAHVVDGATEVTVNLKDGRILEGKVLGKDPLTDLAVIKIEADHLPTVTLGDSDRLSIGEWAIAIGNPLGLDNTVTTGIISATSRSSSQIGVPDKRIDFLQTDAAINPGNSGGPLLNAQGQVIGINTAIIQNAQGLGFAIPINKAEAIATKLIAEGKVEHPFLGISMVSLNAQVKEELAKNKGLPIREEEEGVLIVKVAPNSPASKAGVKSGDLLKSINGKPMNDSSAVQKAVEETPVGNILTLQLNRNQETLKLDVKVGVLPNIS